MKQLVDEYRRIMSISLQKLKRRAQPATTAEEKPPTKKSGRFDGVSEKEIMDKKSTLKDLLADGLDLVFVGINPSLMAAHTGRYYAGPGNHFYKLLYESGLIPEPVSWENDEALLRYNIGLTNIVARATRSSADLSRLELKKGAMQVQDKLKRYKPKIAVFNGKCIYEEFADKYDKASFRFGLQPHKVEQTTLWVVPSSSARCANFPRMQDKLHFYTSLKKYLAFLKGEIEQVDPEEFRFDGKCRQAVPSTSKMWRRKGISAFAGGGRIVNKETICMDTSEENVLSLSIPTTNEFILKNVKKLEDKDKDSEKDSGISASQSDNSQEVNEKDSACDDEEDTVKLELSQEKENEASENDIPQNDKLKSKHKQPSRKTSREKLPSRTAVGMRKERSETIDFVSLIKQRLSDKEAVTNDNKEDCKDKSPSQPNGSVKSLKYANLSSNKSKRGFKIKK